ncbi:hypothetical protein ASF34_01275 [Methylobacterium sp. Leaf106]|nr:hypothetical protein ASF34_01275 [Methylobacterium sp. Leaf106]
MVPERTTIGEMVVRSYPGLPAERAGIIRALVDNIEVPPAMWDCVRPKIGTMVVLKPVPGDGALKNILTIALTVAAVAAGQYYAIGFAGAFGVSVAAGSAGAAISSAIISSSIPATGSLLVDPFGE